MGDEDIYDYMDDDPNYIGPIAPEKETEKKSNNNKSSNWNGFLAAIIVGGPYLLLLWAMGWLNAGSFIVGIILIAIVVNLNSK